MQKTQTSINTQGFNQVANLMLQFRTFINVEITTASIMLKILQP